MNPENSSSFLTMNGSLEFYMYARTASACGIFDLVFKRNLEDRIEESVSSPAQRMTR